jgi:hypothetical protein
MEKEKRIGWFGFLMITIISGLVLRVLGDPLVEVTSPQVKDAMEQTQDALQDEDFQQRVRRFIKDVLSR